jgi:ABC-type lipoprotein export system ATPase subunit
MSTDQRSSQRSSLVRILSRWRRDETSKETAIPEEIEELQEGRLASSAGEERRSARALSAGHKWRTKVAKATTREQMIDLLAMEPTGAQLTPIHEVC